MKFILTLISICCVTSIYGQRCATDEYLNQQGIERAYKSQPQIRRGEKEEAEDKIITIPVVIHVLYNNALQNISDRQIMSQIDALNRDYRRQNADTVNTPSPFRKVAADTKIEFRLAKVDPKGIATSGIVRKHTSEKQFLADDNVKFSAKGGDDAWDATRYLNIWVCNLFGRTLGYAVLPGSPLQKDGVVLKYDVFGTEGVVRAPYNKGRTATHEIGHWLGLQHIWGDKNCGNDQVDDTPQQQAANSGCTTFPHISSCSPDQNGDMFMNFMDFSDDACMNLFTTGQKNRMRSWFDNGNARNSLLYSNVLDSTIARPATPPEAAPLPVPEIDEPVVRIYPNPFVNEIRITTGTELHDRTIHIYNVKGILLKTAVLNKQITTVEMNDLAAGVYIVKIEGGDKPLVYKIVK